MVQADPGIVIIDMPLSELLGGPNPVLDEIMRRVVEQSEVPENVCAFNSAI